MEKILTSLTKYASKGTLVPAEQILTTTLLNFERHIPAKINDTLFDQIEKALLSILNINKGTLSFQASIRIADCLIALYQTSSPPKLWNLFTTVSSHPNPSNIIACGYIIDKIGSSSKSMIAGLATKLVSMTNNDLIFPATYALKQCYKRDRIDLAKISSKALSLAKKGVSSSSEHTILSSLSLLSSLVKQKEISTKRFLSIANDIFKNSSSKFAVDRACYLVAKVAYHPLRILEEKNTNDSKEESDFAIGSSSQNKEEKDPAKELFTQAFSIMSDYKQHFSPILSHFLNLIDPQIICKYLSLLFNTIRRIQPNDISHLMSLFGPDTRTELFELVSSEKPPSGSQLSLLLSLQSSKHSIQELSALAMQLTSSKNIEEKTLGSSFFESLAEVQPEHAMRYLETSMLCLAHPPEGNPNTERDIDSFSLIASHILETIPNRNEKANKVAQHISVYLQRALKQKDFLSAEYRGAFSLMSPLPDYLIPNEDVSESVTRFMKHYQSNSSSISSNSSSFSNSNSISINELNDDHLKLVGYHMTTFFARHEQHELTASFFSFVMDHPSVQSKQGMISICNSAPHVMKGTSTLVQIAKSILPHILKCQPSSDFIADNVKAKMISVNKMIGGNLTKKKSAFAKEKNYNNDNNKKLTPVFALEILKAFPGLVNALPDSFTRQYINLLVNNSSSQMTSCLFLSLCSDEKSILFLDNFDVFPSIWIKLMRDEKKVLILQVLAECVGKWANAFDGHISEILDIADSALDVTKRCFLYAGLLANANLDNDVIVRLMNELDNFALIASSSSTSPNSSSSSSSSSFSSIASSQNCAVYALYALSVLLKTYSDQLAEMNIADIQLRIILSFLNSDKALEPYSLEYIASCFSNLLPVLAISTKDPIVRKSASKSSSSASSLTSFNSLNSLAALTPISSTNTLNSKSMESQVVDNLKLTMQAFRQIKVPYGKQIMFQVLRSVFIFAKDIADDKEMVFPSSKGSSLILQTLACGAFSDMLKVQISNVDYFDMLPRVFILLQRSESKLVSDFIISIAADFAFKCLGHEYDFLQDINFNSFNNYDDEKEDNKESNINSMNESDEMKAKETINSEKNIKRINEWISIVKSILTSNSLPLTGKFTIESNDCVKQCALHLSIFLIPLIVRTNPLVSEYLDDIMTSITRAIETKRPKLTNAAYQLLLTVIGNFEKVHSEGGQRILELYDSQFSIAIRNGFRCDLAFSGPVLVKYIDFKLADIRSNSEEFKALFSAYIEGLSNVKNYNSGDYFIIATHLCHIVEIHEYLFDLIDKYKDLLIVQLCEVISISKALWKSDPQDFEQILNFRRNFASSYGNILVSFIWLQSKSTDSQVLMPVSGMFDFYVDEIANGTEYWRVSAAFSALTAILTFTKDATEQISSAKINEAMNAAENVKSISPKLSIESIPSFMKSVAALSGSMNRKNQSEKDDGENKISINWKQMFSFIVSNEFDLESFGNLINDATFDDIISEFDTIIKTIKVNFGDNNNPESINNDQCIALFTLMMEKSPLMIKILIEFLSENPESKIFAPIKFILYRRLLKRHKLLAEKMSEDDKEKIDSIITKVLPSLSLFAWANFKQGGMDFISQVMIENPEIGLQMFVMNDLKLLTEIALTDCVNCEVYVQFANFGYQVFKSFNNANPDFEIAICKFAFVIIIKWSNDVQKGSNIVQSAVCLINDLINDSGRAVRAAFTAIGPQEQRVVIDNIESQIIKLENKKKVQNLMVFSNSTKRRKQDLDDDGEWQTLDGNDEDSF